MEKLTIWQWIVVVLGILLSISEALPFTDKIKSNGIFQGIINFVKSIVGKKE